MKIEILLKTLICLRKKRKNELDLELETAQKVKKVNELKYLHEKNV